MSKQVAKKDKKEFLKRIYIFIVCFTKLQFRVLTNGGFVKNGFG